MVMLHLAFSLYSRMEGLPLRNEALCCSVDALWLGSKTWLHPMLAGRRTVGLSFHLWSGDSINYLPHKIVVKIK